MTVERFLRTKDLAKAGQVSVQQVRNYEAGGYLPEVARGPNGYRRYERRHLAALLASQRLIDGYGTERAQAIMRAAHQGRLAEALALIDRRHAELDATRLQLDETLAALSLLVAQLPAASHARRDRRLRAGEAAALVGARISALRFWEQQGLLQPAREPGSNYRLYDERQVRRLRIVALLRQASYDFPAIRATLAELEAGQPQRAAAAVEQRRDELARKSWRCLRAMAAFHAYACEFLLPPESS